MNEGLEALERIGKRKYKTTIADITGFETVHVSVKQDNKQDYNTIKKELEEYEQYKAIEKELGLPLNVWIYLAKKELSEDFSKVYIENTVDDEKQRERFMKVNGRPQRYILSVDFDEKIFQIQGTADEWCNEVPFSDYGKTIALTKEELK